ncbi:hypothetical protein NPIL_135771 [Nephila pilipes]|uniref:Uncharacterized protein n=1 Tax=Nephila pilipes TaxID=299642 RepID=A0A8X6UDS8_NEPPI|nr:hypothetical protein NPIL_135771 [Nephila pilipes]
MTVALGSQGELARLPNLKVYKEFVTELEATHDQNNRCRIRYNRKDFIIKSEVLPYFLFLKNEQQIMDPQFQDINYNVPRAKILQNWFNEHEIKVLTQDFNAIEEIRGILKRGVKRKCEHTSNLASLNDQLIMEGVKSDRI